MPLFFKHTLSQLHIPLALYKPAYTSCQAFGLKMRREDVLYIFSAGVVYCFKVIIIEISGKGLRGKGFVFGNN